jgi:hypothetical protein
MFFHHMSCFDPVQDKWSAVYDVRATLMSLRSLLGGELCPLGEIDGTPGGWGWVV